MGAAPVCLVGGGIEGTGLEAWADFLASPRVWDDCEMVRKVAGFFIDRRFYQEKFVGIGGIGWWRSISEKDIGGRKLLEGKCCEAEEVFFRPASDTRPGQEREQKERPRTEDCCVLEWINNRRITIVALLFHFHGLGRLTRFLMARWWVLWKDSGKGPYFLTAGWVSL